jgi:hypothetical protein
LIVLKLGFLLLLVAGPLFLIIGTHPGFGRIIAIRWFEMLVGVLMKQVAVAVALSVLLYCYSLIMGTADTVLPWALKILMIALVTVAVFIYRKPFTHLFSAVGYGTLGSAERAEGHLRTAGVTFRRNTLVAATAAIPGVAGQTVTRWARRNPGQAATSAETAAGTGTGAAGDAYAARFRPDAPPADGDGDVETSPGSRRGATAASLGRSRNIPETGNGDGRTAPPLELPARPGTGNGTGGSGPAGADSSWSRGAGRSTPPALPPVRSRATSGSTPSSRSAPPASRASGNGNGANGTSGKGNGANGTSGKGNGANGTSGKGNGANGNGTPAWPYKPSSGWLANGASTGAGPRQRPPAERRPAPPRQEPAGSGRIPAGGNRSDEPRAGSFWLRPIRRDK